MRRFLLAVIVGAVVAASCGGSTAPTTASTSTSITLPKETGSMELGPADRPAQLVAPDKVTAPAPLVVLLHAYLIDADIENDLLGVTEQAASRGLYVLLPNGTKDRSGKRFWDATAACCNYNGPPVDDVDYLVHLINQAIRERPIDPHRVYLFGHSNGSFMAYRLACDRADKVTAIAVWTGGDAQPSKECTPSRPVSVLHLHGTKDEWNAYGGAMALDPNRLPLPYFVPGAAESVRRWAKRDGCDTTTIPRTPVDFVESLPGAETMVAAYKGCARGTDVQLDTIKGGTHFQPLIHDSVGRFVLDWLLAHSSA